MLAAAQAVLSGQTGWGPLGLTHQSGGATTNGDPLAVVTTTATPHSISAGGTSYAPAAPAGATGTVAATNGTVVTAAGSAANSFLGWGSQTEMHPAAAPVPQHTVATSQIPNWSSVPKATTGWN